MRASEPGWIKIGITCSAGRRSLWTRVGRTKDTAYVELCAGREGDDDYVLIDETNPAYRELVRVLTTAVYAADNATPHKSTATEEK